MTMACSCTFTSLPLSFDSHTFASLFKLFTRFFQSCLASGSTFRRTNSCSRNSLRRFSNRPRSSVPICRAACTAHPRSPSCRQSLNRHSLASKSMSAKACATPSSASHSCISRNPGVSMSSAPPGKTNSSLLVVVCRPRLSLSRTGRTSCTVCLSSRFAIVDFPTPDDPSSTNVCPGLRNPSSSPKPSPVFTLKTHTAVPTATRSISTAFARASSQASALFSTITGLAPDSQHCARYRSTRRGLKSPSNADTSNAVSTFAAITCSSIFFPGDLRTNLLGLGRTSWITAVVSVPWSSATTQSPTVGQSAPSSAASRSLPLASARHSPNSPATRQNFRCCATTRAGTAFFQSPPHQNASKYEFHPHLVSAPVIDTDESSCSLHQHGYR